MTGPINEATTEGRRLTGQRLSEAVGAFQSPRRASEAKVDMRTMAGKQKRKGCMVHGVDLAGT